MRHYCFWNPVENKSQAGKKCYGQTSWLPETSTKLQVLWIFSRFTTHIFSRFLFQMSGSTGEAQNGRWVALIEYGHNFDILTFFPSRVWSCLTFSIIFRNNSFPAARLFGLCCCCCCCWNSFLEHSIDGVIQNAWICGTFPFCRLCKSFHFQKRIPYRLNTSILLDDFK